METFRCNWGCGGNKPQHLRPYAILHIQSDIIYSLPASKRATPRWRKRAEKKREKRIATDQLDEGHAWAVLRALYRLQPRCRSGSVHLLRRRAKEYPRLGGWHRIAVTSATPSRYYVHLPIRLLPIRHYYTLLPIRHYYTLLPIRHYYTLLALAILRALAPTPVSFDTTNKTRKASIHFTLVSVTRFSCLLSIWL